MPKQGVAPKWSEEDVNVGKNFLAASHEFSGTFAEKKDKVAQSLGYTGGYTAMSEGVRAYISHIGQEVKQKKKNYLIEQRVGSNLIQMKKDWQKQFEENPDFRHAMTHPDEETTE